MGVDEGPNHAAWEEFDAVMRSLSDTMDDGPMVTNADGVEFLDALARRGYEVRPLAARAEGLDGLVEALREAQFAAHQLARHSGHARDCRQHQCAGWLALAARARRPGGEGA